MLTLTAGMIFNKTEELEELVFTFREDFADEIIMMKFIESQLDDFYYDI